MSFANPSALWLLLVVMAFIACTYAYSLSLQKKLSKWISASLWKDMIPDFSKKVFIRKNISLALALFFLIIALARPQWGEREEVIQSEGMDILFVLDLSTSMLAEDTPPSRLNRAQTFIKKSLQNLADDRVGIVAFAGKAFLTVPLTTDFGYVSEITDTLEPSNIINQGTNIGEAISVAIKAFERGGEDNHKTTRAIVLISDGEDFGDDALKAAEKLKEFGAGFFALSVGTPEGAPIPLRNEAGILQTYKKDRNEKTVLSRVNRDFMAKIATAGGGSYLELVNPDDAAYVVSKQLNTFHRAATKEQRQITKIDRFPYFLLVSIILFFVNFFIGYRGILLLFFIFLPQFSNAQTLDSYLKSRQALKNYDSKNFDDSAKLYEDSRAGDAENPTLQLNEGTALAKGKRPEDAIVNLNEASKKALSQGDYETAAKSLYNEGVVLSEQKNLKESYDRLTKAIELSKVSNQPEVEKKAREALVSLVEKQKQKSQEEKQNKDQKDDQNKKDKKDKKDKDDQQKKSGQGEPDKDDQNGKDQQKKNNQRPTDAGKREFKSGTLSKDVAESIMNDLSDREKQLYQHRLKERKTREVPNDKDW